MTCGAFVYNNEKNALGDDELHDLSLFFVTEKKCRKKNQETTMSLLVHRHLLQPKKNQHKMTKN
jgi:hypothetical protein